MRNFLIGGMSLFVISQSTNGEDDMQNLINKKNILLTKTPNTSLISNIISQTKVFRDKVPELLRILCSFLLRFCVDIVQLNISIIHRFCLDSKVISVPCLLL